MCHLTTSFIFVNSLRLTELAWTSLVCSMWYYLYCFHLVALGGLGYSKLLTHVSYNWCWLLTKDSNRGWESFDLHKRSEIDRWEVRFEKFDWRDFVMFRNLTIHNNHWRRINILSKRLLKCLSFHFFFNEDNFRTCTKDCWE